MQERKMIGELLLEAGFISEDQLRQALKIQVGGDRRLGRIFLQMGAITSDQLVEILAKQLDLPITDIDQSFRLEAKNLLPRYICRRYGVLPLELQDDTIMSVAMVDPSDTEAIRDIERFTGKAVHPALARHQDILAGISKHIPYSLRELRNPAAMSTVGKAFSVITLILIILVAVFTHRFYIESRYGTIARTPEATLFKNHDLIVGYNQAGDVTLLGRGAYASGYYSITFKSVQDLDQFIRTKRTDFSENQFAWIQWTISARK